MPGPVARREGRQAKENKISQAKPIHGAKSKGRGLKTKPKRTQYEAK
jgi:hypothetical protein